MDGDLFENDTSALPGYESQIIGGGFEVTSQLGRFDLAFRGGMFTNLAIENPDEVYTIGLEVRRGPLTISTEGHLTASDINVEAESSGSRRRDFPDRVGGSLSIGIEW